MFCIRLKALLDKPGNPPDCFVVFYLTDHGKRREWDLLYQHCQREVDLGLDDGTGRVLPTLVNSSKAQTSPLAIPCLGLALTRTKLTGSRSLEGIDGQPFSCADEAAEYLQKLTGVDFGYVKTGSAEERSVAILKARKWWHAEGRKKYTFDYCETMMKKKPEEPK